MVKRLVWTEKALLSKKEIFEYWNKKNSNKKYSQKLETDFERIANFLKTFPELGKKFENYDARVILHRDYSMIYKVIEEQKNQEIKILQVWDTRRDPDGLKI